MNLGGIMAFYTGFILLLKKIGYTTQVIIY